MEGITAVIHTRNSAKTLSGCLKSVSWCDAVYVVDMQSEDGTIEIAKRFGAKIFQVSSQHVYADPIRNEYLKKVKTSWTLILDSDEEIPPSLASKLATLKMTTGVNGYSIPRKNLVLGKWIEHTGYWPDYIVRFFRTGKASYPAPVHSQPVVEGVHEFLPPELEFAIIHHHYETITAFVSKLNIYTSLETEKLLSSDISFSPLLALKEFFNQFHTRYFKWEGYKDGSVGFTLSLLSSVYQLISYLKAWEVTKNEQQHTLESVEEEVVLGCEATSYWVANESIKSEKNALRRLLLKIRRRLHS